MLAADQAATRLATRARRRRAVGALLVVVAGERLSGRAGRSLVQAAREHLLAS